MKEQLRGNMVSFLCHANGSFLSSFVLILALWKAWEGLVLWWGSCLRCELDPL